MRYRYRIRYSIVYTYACSVRPSCLFIQVLADSRVSPYNLISSVTTQIQNYVQNKTNYLVQIYIHVIIK